MTLPCAFIARKAFQISSKCCRRTSRMIFIRRWRVISGIWSANIKVIGLFCLKMIHVWSKRRRKDATNHHHWNGEGVGYGFLVFLAYALWRSTFNLVKSLPPKGRRVSWKLQQKTCSSIILRPESHSWRMLRELML